MFSRIFEGMWIPRDRRPRMSSSYPFHCPTDRQITTTLDARDQLIIVLCGRIRIHTMTVADNTVARARCIDSDTVSSQAMHRSNSLGGSQKITEAGPQGEAKMVTGFYSTKGFMILPSQLELAVWVAASRTAWTSTHTRWCMCMAWTRGDWQTSDCRDYQRHTKSARQSTVACQLKTKYVGRTQNRMDEIQLSSYFSSARCSFRKTIIA